MNNEFIRTILLQSLIFLQEILLFHSISQLCHIVFATLGRKQATVLDMHTHTHSPWAWTGFVLVIFQ